MSTAGNRRISCTGKVAYDSWSRATQGADRGNRRDGVHLQPYHCHHCHRIHVGEGKPRQRRPEPKRSCEGDDLTTEELT